MQKEIWKDVVGFEKYFMVSNLGNVFSKRTNKLLKKVVSKTGYYIFATKIGGRNGKDYCFKIHRLVAEAFLPTPPESLIAECSETDYGVVPVNHIDGNKLNNCADNLQWCSYKENSMHAISTGLIIYKKGFENSSSRLTPEQVEEIRSSYVPYDKEFGTRGLADKFNLHHTTISRIVRKLRY